MLIAYPALFYYDDSIETKYFVHFPDFINSATQGKDLADALYMASDYLGLVVSDIIESDDPLPTPSKINNLSLAANDPFKNDADFTLTYDSEKSFISMVYVDINSYLGADNPIKKTLTIPKWANDLGMRYSINFSKTLTDAIVEKTTNGFSD